MLSRSSLPDASQQHVELDRHTSGEERKKKKKKKRSHEEVTAGDATEREHREKKKKKRKHREDGASDQVNDVEEPAAVCENEAEKPKKKKKKKKDKGKNKEAASPIEQPQEQILDGELDVDSQTALLNAIAAAVAKATPAEQPEMQEDLQSDPAVGNVLPPPPGPATFLPFPAPGALPFPSFLEGSSDGSNAFLPHLPPNIFNELSYGSGDDVLRALQDLDMSKITSFLKSANDGSMPGAPPFPLPPAFVPGPLPLAPASSTLLGQVPVGANAILGRHSKHITPPPIHAPSTKQHTGSPAVYQTNNQHAETLCTKWLSAAKLAELVQSEGLVYKKGKFSATEEQHLTDAIEHYRTSNCLTEEQIADLIFPKNEKQRNNQFWTELTRAVPQRPIIAVYHHVRRKHHPLKQQGPWTEAEDQALRQAVADLGQQWEKIHPRVGRMASDCRDRYRNHLLNREIRVNGAWSPEEEQELTRIVTDMTVKQGRDIDNDVFWGRVSELMGGKRNRQQCRIKWTDSLSKLVKSGDSNHKSRWSQQDAYILVHKVDSLNVRDDTEIDWKTLPDPTWNLWSAHTLQRRWLTMKKSIKGYEDMTHQEIMDILRVKKAHAPADSVANIRKRKNRKIVSASTIDDDTALQAEAGSSTGPGTAAQVLHK